MFLIDCIMNSRAFGLNFGNDKLLMRVFEKAVVFELFAFASVMALFCKPLAGCE